MVTPMVTAHQDPLKILLTGTTATLKIYIYIINSFRTVALNQRLTTMSQGTSTFALKGFTLEILLGISKLLASLRLCTGIIISATALQLI